MTSLSRSSLRAGSLLKQSPLSAAAAAPRSLSTLRVAVAPAATTLSASRQASILPTAYQRASSFHSSAVSALQKDSASSKDKSWVNKGAVDYKEIKPLTESPPGDLYLIDVREPTETSAGMIPSAVNVPLSEFSTAFKATGAKGSGGGDFSKKYAFDRPSFGDKIVFYCRSGKRSQQALEEAKKEGWWNVRNYEGSWLDWTAQEKSRGNNQED